MAIDSETFGWIRRIILRLDKLEARVNALEGAGSDRAYTDTQIVKLRAEMNGRLDQITRRTAP